MADRKITDLTALAAGSQATGDLLTIVDVSEGAAADKNKKITVESLLKGIPSDVGIGITSPAAKLAIHTTTTTNSSSQLLRITSANGALFGIETDETVSNPTWKIGGIVSGGTAEPLAFYQVGSEVARIDSSGRLLLGTTTARANLTVALGNGSIPAAGASTGAAVFSNGTDGAVYGVVVGANTSGTGYIQSQRTDGTATTYNLAVQPNGGNVGIGTTSPNSLLDCAGGNITLTEDTNLIFKNAARNTNRGAIQFTSGGEFRVRYGSLLSEALRIDSSGRLLVGTSSSSGTNTLVVQGHSGGSTGQGLVYIAKGAATPANGDQLGAIWFSDNTHTASAGVNAQRDGGTWSGSSKPSRLVFSTTADGASSPTERMRINSAGNVKLTGGQALFWDDAGDRYIACIGDTTSNINLHGRANVIFKTGGSSYDGGTERARVTSNGLTFNGDTAAANALNDYEEGTWTPVMNKSGVSGTAGTPSAAHGFYRKIGKLLWISFYWYRSSGTFGNNSLPWYVSGLPYDVAFLQNSAYQFISLGYYNLNGSNYSNDGRWQSNNTNGADTLTMYSPNQGTNWTSSGIEFSGTGVLMIA